ncbi:hypothetical protein HOG21_05525 [bacterium]|nr:hypothetical protein [bacterium]
MLLIVASQFHSCSFSVSSIVSLVNAFALTNMFEYVGYLMYFVSTIVFSLVKVTFTESSLGSNIAKSYSLSTSNFKSISIDLKLISNIILFFSSIVVSSSSLFDS